MASGFRSGDRARAKARFRALAPAIKRGVEDALESNAAELAEAIRRRVPIDQGDLAESVTWKKGAARDQRSRKGRGDDPDLTVRVIEGFANKGFYAAMVEFGTVNTAAQPHFFPTWRQNKRRIKARLSRAVSKAIKGASK